MAHAHGDGPREFRPLGIAILTVSDTRTLDDDRSGALLEERARGAGHRVVHRAIVRDEVEAIRERVRAWAADDAVQVVIVTGGTGIAGRDVTPEALDPLFDKALPGFGELFRWLSWRKIGAAAIQSRATAGIVGATYVFAVPGSTGACRDAWDDILGPQLDARTAPCNFAEMLPRLAER